MYSEKEEKYYSGLTQDNLLELSNRELTWAIFVRTDHLMAQLVNDETAKAQLAEPVRVANLICDFYNSVFGPYIAHNSVFERPDIEEGELGMRFYLGGFSRNEYVPLISEYLGIIGADEHKAVLDEFFVENNINVHDLSQFARIIDKEYNSQAELYDFSATDEKLRGVKKDLTTLLANYVRENIGCFAEKKARKPKKPSAIETQKKKTLARNLLKKILVALHEKRFDDVASMVTESTLNAADIEEFIQGTVEVNGFGTMDKYIAKNECGFYTEENRTSIEYYLTADGNQELPLLLILDFEEHDDGTVTTTLDISPD